MTGRNPSGFELQRSPEAGRFNKRSISDTNRTPRGTDWIYSVVAVCLLVRELVPVKDRVRPWLVRYIETYWPAYEIWRVWLVVVCGIGAFELYRFTKTTKTLNGCIMAATIVPSEVATLEKIKNCYSCPWYETGLHLLVLAICLCVSVIGYTQKPVTFW